MIIIVRHMKRHLLQKLTWADQAGVWAFTPATFSALLGEVEPRYLNLMMKRLADQGALIRAARGVYMNPHARSMPNDVRGGLIRFLRPREVSYVSLESKLSEAGAKRPANNHRAAHRTGCTKQMSDAPRNSVKRDADRVRPLKSWRQIRLSLIGELGQLELIVLLPLVFTANVIVATVLWFVVGPLLR
jgi:hypothetical protein